MARFAVCLTGFLLLTACASERMPYLELAEDQATDTEVVSRLGSPDSIIQLRRGREALVYRSFTEELSCIRYTLIFDPQRVLREWWRTLC